MNQFEDPQGKHNSIKWPALFSFSMGPELNSKPRNHFHHIYDITYQNKLAVNDICT